MKTNHCFRKSKKMHQKKRKQRTKKNKKTRTKGGFHIIEPDVDEVDMDVDANISPSLRDLMDEMISVPTMQKRIILTVNQLFIDLQSLYTESHPDEVIEIPHIMSIHDKTDVLLHTFSLNINNVTSLIENMIEDNDIDTAQIIHDCIMDQIKPYILTAIGNHENLEYTANYLNHVINEQSPYQRQFKIDFEILLDNHINFTDSLESFIGTQGRELGQFCTGDDYNENDYIMPLSVLS